MLIWGPKIANLPQFGQKKNFLIKKTFGIFVIIERMDRAEFI